MRFLTMQKRTSLIVAALAAITCLPLISLADPPQPGSIYAWDLQDVSPPGNDFVKVSAGSHFLGLRTDGSIVEWDAEGNTSFPHTPTGTGFRDIVASNNYYVAIKADGSLIYWKYSSSGSLSEESYSAVAVDSGIVLAVKTDSTIDVWGWPIADTFPGNDYKDVAVGDWHCVALKNDGSLEGGCYSGDFVPSGNDYQAITANSAGGLALKNDGSLVAWSHYSSEQPDVPAGNDFVAIASGMDFSMALRSNGTVAIWGNSTAEDSEVNSCSSIVTAIGAGQRSATPLAIRQIGDRPPTLTSPNGGENWSAGTTHTISWDTEFPDQELNIWLQKDNITCDLIGRVPVADGSFAWTIPDIMESGNDYSIRLHWVSSCGFVYEDTSDSTFTITCDTPLPEVTVTSPNGGEVWPADSTQTITWDSTNPLGMAYVWHYENNRDKYRFIGETPMAAGQIEWAIPPDIACTNGMILVRSSFDSTVVKDSSDAEFEITPAGELQLNLIRPAGGENWLTGTTEPIIWTANIVNGTVDINLLKNGRPYAKLGSAPAAAGIFNWDICPGMDNGGDYAIYLRENTLSLESSTNGLSISGSQSPELTLTSPAGGESWQAGTPQTITWTSSNLAGEVEIVLPDTADTNWGHVFVPIADGSFTWPVPANTELGNKTITIRSTDCGLEIEDSATITITESTALPGDVDGDGDLDLHDLAILQTCFTGSVSKLLTPPCMFFDFDPDADIDLNDYMQMHDNLTGP